MEVLEFSLANPEQRAHLSSAQLLNCSNVSTPSICSYLTISFQNPNSPFFPDSFFFFFFHLQFDKKHIIIYIYFFPTRILYNSFRFDNGFFFITLLTNVNFIQNVSIPMIPCDYISTWHFESPFYFSLFFLSNFSFFFLSTFSFFWV